MPANSLTTTLDRLYARICEDAGCPPEDPNSEAASVARQIVGAISGFAYEGSPDIEEALPALQKMTGVNIKQFLIRHGFDDWWTD